MISAYRPGSGFLHRTPAGVKLGVLAAVALTLSFVPAVPATIAPILALTVVVSLLFPLAGFRVRELGAAWWSLRWLILLVGVALGVFAGVPSAVVNTGRLVSLLLLAELVARTTATSAMMGLIVRLLGPFRRLGVDPDAVALVLAITLTMVPVLAGFVQAVRDAQDARGVRLGLRAALPILVRAMRHADAVGEALVARGIGP